MIYRYTIDNIPVQTGDIICTVDGSDDANDIKGKFWRLLGKLIRGDVDHIIVYIGPEGRCVESGAKGKVITFEVKDNSWDYKKMYKRRGIIDHLYGVVYPLYGKNFSQEKENKIRESVGKYCEKQAKEKKPYNINFLDSSTQKAFYCSQLAYAAYKKHGINLNSNKGVPKIPGTSNIVFPQEIWKGFHHVKYQD